MNVKPKIDQSQHLPVSCPNCMAVIASQSRFCKACGKDFFNQNSNPPPPSLDGWPQQTYVPPHPARLGNIRRAHIHLMILVALGIVFTAIFLWGFYGFVIVGSSGPPPRARAYAFWAGGTAYLVLLLFATAFKGSEDSINNGFGLRAKTNLKWTVVALLACFPAALLFIGFVAPPFIFAISAIGLLKSLLQEPIEGAAGPWAGGQGCVDTLLE